MSTQVRGHGRRLEGCGREARGPVGDAASDMNLERDVAAATASTRPHESPRVSTQAPQHAYSRIHAAEEADEDRARDARDLRAVSSSVGHLDL